MKVTKEAKEALRKSIIKWEEDHTKLVLVYGKKYILHGLTVCVNVMKVLFRHSSVECPCCQLSWKKAGEECYGDYCIIAADTQRQNCKGTPFYDWMDIFRGGGIIGDKEVRSHLDMVIWMKELYKECEV